MLLQMIGQKGQGDIWEQREIIRKLATNENTKLCLVVETYSSYDMQDDTAVPLDLNYQLVDLYERVFKHLDGHTLMDFEGDLIRPIVENLFGMTGLVVLDCRTLGQELRAAFMCHIKNYYWKSVCADKLNKTHLVYVWPSE